MQTLLLLTNFFFLLLWPRVWRRAEGEFHFNPLISAPLRLTDRLFDFLRPVLVGFGTRAMAATTLLFLIAFRGALFSRLHGEWTLVIGMSYGRRLATSGGWQAGLLFSLADFFLFMTRLWGLALLVALLTPVPRHDRVSEAFRYFTLPISLLPRAMMALAVVLLNAFLIMQLQHLGEPLTGEIAQGMRSLNLTIDWSLPLEALPKLAWLTALALADILLVARAVMLGLVLTILLAILLRHRGLAEICNEGVQMLLGCFGRRPVGIGTFDLTPVIFFIVMNLLYSLAVALLRALLQWMPWT